MEVNVSNLSLSQRNSIPLHTVKRQTTHASGPNPQWNDSIEVRCCLGWDIAISIIVQDSKMSLHNSPFLKDSNNIDNSLHRHHNHNKYSNNVFRVDNLVTGNCTSGQYYLRRDGKVCGDIFLTLEYFPNHQSLLCLAEEVVACNSGDSGESARDAPLLMLLLGELVGMIRQSVSFQ